MAAQSTRQIARSTLIVMVAFGAAKVISLVQTYIIARTFGVSSEWDAYVVANSIPELIFTLIAGGALSFAFIPIFAGFLAQGDTAKAWKTATHVINTLFVLALIVSAVAFVIAPWLVSSVIATGFTPEAQAQTVSLMRVLLLGTLIFCISGIWMGILQSFNNFLLPALAPILYNVGLLIGVIALVPRFGVFGVAYGAVIGAGLHLLIQLPGMLRVKAKWWAELGLSDPTLWRILRLMLPALGGLAVNSLNWLVMNNLASRLSEGSVSALSWGWRLMQIPETLIGTAVGTVMFPTLAALSAVEDARGKRETLAGAIRFILIATIPASAALLVLGRPLLALLEGGAFDASATEFVYSTLQFFTLGLVVQSVLEVAARAFYADKNTLIPFITSSIGAAVTIAGAYLLSAGIGVGGLALAYSLGITIEVSINLLLLRRRWQGIEENSLFVTAFKAVAASLVMAAVIIGIGALWSALGLTGRGSLLLIAQIGVQGALGVIAFLVSAWLLRMKELDELTRLIRQRIPAKAAA